MSDSVSDMSCFHSTSAVACRTQSSRNEHKEWQVWPSEKHSLVTVKVKVHIHYEDEPPMNRQIDSSLAVKVECEGWTLTLTATLTVAFPFFSDSSYSPRMNFNCRMNFNRHQRMDLSFYILQLWFRMNFNCRMNFNRHQECFSEGGRGPFKNHT